MTNLDVCRNYYYGYIAKYGDAPKYYRMTQLQLDTLKDEVKWTLTHACETPTPNTIYGMEIIIVED